MGRQQQLHVRSHCDAVWICISTGYASRCLAARSPVEISRYLSRAVRGGRGDDGLIQRFGLLVWPDVSSAWANVDRSPDKDARTAAFQVFEDLENLDWHGYWRQARSWRGWRRRPVCRISGSRPDAIDRFVEWRTDWEKRLRSGDLHPALELHLAKYRKLVPGLALISHLVDVGTGFVGLAELERALAWAKYLETHARRAYGSVTCSFGDLRLTRSSPRSVLAHLKSEFRSHDVWRPGWSKLDDSEVVRAGLGMLVDYDWLRVRKVQTAGRPASIYVVNPKILKD